jgi:ssDNA-binding Zn-finger/Zn-ribbon topoisomerase 1
MGRGGEQQEGKDTKVFVRRPKCKGNLGDKESRRAGRFLIQ